MAFQLTAEKERGGEETIGGSHQHKGPLSLAGWADGETKGRRGLPPWPKRILHYPEHTPLCSTFPAEEVGKVCGAVIL